MAMSIHDRVGRLIRMGLSEDVASALEHAAGEKPSLLDDIEKASRNDIKALNAEWQRQREASRLAGRVSALFAEIDEETRP